MTDKITSEILGLLFSNAHEVLMRNCKKEFAFCKSELLNEIITYPHAKDIRVLSPLCEILEQHGIKYRIYICNEYKYLIYDRYFTQDGFPIPDNAMNEFKLKKWL